MRTRRRQAAVGRRAVGVSCDAVSPHAVKVRGSTRGGRTCTHCSLCGHGGRWCRGRAPLRTYKDGRRACQRMTDLLFNTYRVPCPHEDELHTMRGTGGNHILVLRRGRAFVADVVGSNGVPLHPTQVSRFALRRRSSCCDARRVTVIMCMLWPCCDHHQALASYCSRRRCPGGNVGAAHWLVHRCRPRYCSPGASTQSTRRE